MYSSYNVVVVSLSNTMSDKETVKMTVPFPKSVHEKVKRLADTERRSMNQQIIYMLEKYEEK